MKLRHNEYCPSVDQVGAAAGNPCIMRAAYSPVLTALTIHISQGDIGKLGHRRKCGN